MNAPLLKGRDLLTKKNKFSIGSKQWKILMAKAVTLAVNSEFHEYRVSEGRRGMNPELQFHIIFIGAGPFTKCKVELWLGEYEFARAANAVNSFDAADAFAGVSKNEFSSMLF